MSTTTPRWSHPVETLLATGQPRACDVLIIGSGYGGSFAARELAAKGCETWVVERGREFALGEFAEDIGHLPGQVKLHREDTAKAVGNPQALMDFRMFKDVTLLLANGLGGGSLINAGVARKPDAGTFATPQWPAALRSGARHGELTTALDEVVAALDAAPLPQAEKLLKFRALSRLGTALAIPPAQPLHLTIAGTRKLNPQGVQMEACIQCGNCFTGCNVGAKGTLATSIIPAAVKNGAKFHTGAKATRIEPLDAAAGQSPNGRPLRWRVYMERTGANANEPAGLFTLDTHTLIVSAGTLGSTELLLRSQSAALSMSGQLGKRFSTNGDVIAMGWRQDREVNAVSAPRADGAEPSRDVGPTITGTLRVPLDVEGKRQHILVQEGAIPSALAQAVTALGSSLSLLHRYAGDADARFAGTDDPLAVPPDAARHLQLLLAMGHDASDGQIVMKDVTDAGQTSRQPDITWPEGSSGGGRAPYYKAVHEALMEGHKARGFDGGDYLPSPLWHPAPDNFAEIAAGSQPERAMSVHPLGGCAMADDAEGGVVDWRGAVFTGQGAAVHEGLHVLDGAIMPGALGVNPFVTISALSLVAARSIRASLQGTAAAPQAQALPASDPALPQPRIAGKVPFSPAAPITLRFREHLQGHSQADELPAWAQAMLSAHDVDLTLPLIGMPRAFITSVDVTLDVQQWLADPSTKWPATMSIYPNPYADWPTVRTEVMDLQKPLLQGSGTVALLALDGAWYKRPFRLVDAVLTYVKRRPGPSFLAKSSNKLNAILAFVRAGWLATQYRTLDYDFELHPQTPVPELGGKPVTARGSKLLAYRHDGRNLWDALTQLDLTLEHPAGQPWQTFFKVDLADMVKRMRLQIGKAPNTPAAIIGLAAFASVWLKAIMQTHFWSMRGLDYEIYQPVKVPPAPPLTPEGGQAPIKPEVMPLVVPRAANKDRDGTPVDSNDTIELRLTRYAHPDTPEVSTRDRKTLLMIHGLAHGSGVFTTDTVAVNMASHFLGKGYNVWLLDSRMSNALPHSQKPHTMDDIAACDIRFAINHIHEHSADAGKQLHVFAHCVGAGAFAMAVLSGWVRRERIAAVIIHAVHPWVVPSVSNRFSGALAALYRDLLQGDEDIVPLIPAKADAKLMDELLDRFAGTLPWPEEDLALHEQHRQHPQAGCAICNRMTVFYGREWKHANLDTRTHERLGELVGPAGLEVFRQLYFIILRQRLTDREGNNRYLTQGGIMGNWRFPVMFVHGSDNQVFDPRGAVRSWNRLRRFDTEEHPRVVRLFIRKGYGHMDFLFGKEAARDIYPRLSEFFSDPKAFKDEAAGFYVDTAQQRPPGMSTDLDYADRDAAAPVRPLCGPMLQIETLPGGLRKLVIWVEQHFDTTSQPLDPLFTLGEEELKGVLCLPPPPVVVMPLTGPAQMPWIGSGKYWTCVIEETETFKFAGMKPLTITLLCEAPGIGFIDPFAEPDAGGGDARRVVATGGNGNKPVRRPGFNNGVWSLELGTLSRLDPGLLTERFVGRLRTDLVAADAPADLAGDGGEAGDGQQKTPVLETGLSVTLDPAALPWWKRWAETAPGDAPALPVSFIAASCRWPGMGFEQDAVDGLARHILPHVSDPELPAEALLLLGDQIYADATANVAETTERAERGAQRYRDSWTGKATRELFAKLPVWMVLDDHEFGDNIDGAGRQPADSPRGLDFLYGFSAAFAYQSRFHRSDLPSLALSGNAYQVTRGFWHEFSIGGLPAFAADTRTEREPRDTANWQQAKLMHDAQFNAICNWLIAHKDKPKLLLSGSVFGLVENHYGRSPALCQNADSWCGYPATWRRLVRFIVDKGISNLVFVSGDYHLSAMSELTLESGGRQARALSIICSGWNASLPFANALASDFTFGQAQELPMGDDEARVHAKATLASDAARQFAKITLSGAAGGHELKMRIYGNGETPIATLGATLQ